jgi:hypothetical protein
MKRSAPPRGARVAVWLGLCGIVLQALLPLLVASAGIAADYHPPAAVGAESAIHPHHGGHLPVQHVPPAGHKHDHGAHCILCLGLHAVGPMALPSAGVLTSPAEPSDTISASAAPRPRIGRAATPYAPRGPPNIG